MKNSLRNIKLFYETSSYSLPSVERKCIERSLANNLQGLITRSSPELKETFELVQDVCGLYDEDDNDTDNNNNTLYVGHIIGQNNLKDIKNELKLIEDGFKYSSSKSYLLNHLSIQPNEKELLNLNFLKDNYQNLSSFLESSSTFSRFSSSTSSSSSSLFPSLSLDISGRYLMELSSDELEKLSNNILELNHTKGLQILHLPYNYLTYKSSLKLKNLLDKNFSSSSPLSIIATETLRTNLKIPGQISVDFNYHSPHLADENELALKGHEEELLSLSSELASRLKACLYSSNDLKHVLDSALQVEKILLTKLAPQIQELSIPLPKICLAHAMAHNLSSIHSAEQLDYMLYSSIEQDLEESLDKARIGGKELADWVTIYKPVSKRIIQSIRHSYHMKSLYEAQEILEKLSKYNKNKEEIKFDSLPWRLGHLSLNTLHSDAVALSLMNVSPTNFNSVNYNIKENNLDNFFEDASKILSMEK